MSTLSSTLTRMDSYAEGTTPQRVIRAGRRLRAALAQVEDLRLALDQELARAWHDDLDASVIEMARWAGLSRESVYAAIRRQDERDEATGGVFRDHEFIAHLERVAGLPAGEKTDQLDSGRPPGA